MRQGPSVRRPRSRGNGRKGAPSRPSSFESNGPDVKVRGNAHQVVEKYLALARDATTSGDRITAENYYQHAEHYYRVMNAVGDGANGHSAPKAPEPPETQLGEPEEVRGNGVDESSASA